MHQDKIATLDPLERIALLCGYLDRSAAERLLPWLAQHELSAMLQLAARAAPLTENKFEIFENVIACALMGAAFSPVVEYEAVVRFTQNSAGETRSVGILAQLCPELAPIFPAALTDPNFSTHGAAFLALFDSLKADASLNGRLPRHDQAQTVRDAASTQPELILNLLRNWEATMNRLDSPGPKTALTGEGVAADIVRALPPHWLAPILAGFSDDELLRLIRAMIGAESLAHHALDRWATFVEGLRLHNLTRPEDEKRIEAAFCVLRSNEWLVDHMAHEALQEPLIRDLIMADDKYAEVRIRLQELEANPGSDELTQAVLLDAGGVLQVSLSEDAVASMELKAIALAAVADHPVQVRALLLQCMNQGAP